MHYHFFDYKYNIQGFDTDLYSTTHIVWIVIAFLSIIAIGYFLRKVDHKKLTWFLRGLAIFVTLLEISKITWESYYDITTGRGFNVGGILPFYSCSLLIYCLWFGAWGKGKAREVALTWLSTIGLFCGIIGTIYLNGLNWYPFWTYGAWDSILFHYNLFLVGVLLLATGYKKLEWKDIYIAIIPMVLLSVIASPLNYYYGADYMQIYSADGVPLMSDFAAFLHSHNLRPVFTVFMLAFYMVLSAFVVSISKLVDYLIKRFHGKKSAPIEASEPSELSPVEALPQKEEEKESN